MCSRATSKQLEKLMNPIISNSAIVRLALICNRRREMTVGFLVVFLEYDGEESETPKLSASNWVAKLSR